MRSKTTPTLTSVLVSFCLLFQLQFASANTVTLAPDTSVYVETKEALIAKGDQVQQGQSVRAKVWRDVIVDGHVVIAAGTVFDAYIDRSMQVEIGEKAEKRTIDLSYIGDDITAELLYDNLANTEKPKYFEFEITVPQAARKNFVIDRINSKSVKPLKLDIVSERNEDDETIASARIKIKILVKEFVKGINTIEIVNIAGDQRVATSLIVDIEI